MRRRDNAIRTCDGNAEQPGCGAPIRWARTAAARPMPLDAEPTSAGNVVLEAGVAVVLSPERAQAYEGEKFMPHHVTCPVGTAFRASRPNHVRRPPAVPMGEFQSPTERNIAGMAAGDFELRVLRRAEEFLAVLRRKLGARKVYDRDAVTEAFRAFRREHGIEKAEASEIVAKVKTQINLTEASAA